MVLQDPGRSLAKELKALLPDLPGLVGPRRVTLCFDWGDGLRSCSESCSRPASSSSPIAR